MISTHTISFFFVPFTVEASGQLRHDFSSNDSKSIISPPLLLHVANRHTHTLSLSIQDYTSHSQ